jgi:hypothetical protein
MTGKERKEVLDRAEQEVQAFEAWFKTTGAGELSKFERAILKTYVVAKTTNQFRTETESSVLGPCRLT